MEHRSGREATEAPEAVNRAQQEDGQVLDAADLRRGGETMPVGQSDHGHQSDPADVIPDDVPDVIDRMEEMVRSGRIDTDAYDGEPIHEDAEGPFGDDRKTLDGDAPRP